MTNEQYKLFSKNLKKAHYISYTIQTKEEISLTSWSAPATIKVELTWKDDGADCSYTQEFEGKIIYAQDDVETIGHVSYQFHGLAQNNKYIFHLAKDITHLFFILEITDTLRKNATCLDLTVNIDAENYFYPLVPVSKIVTQLPNIKTTLRTVTTVE